MLHAYTYVSAERVVVNKNKNKKSRPISISGLKEVECYGHVVWDVISSTHADAFRIQKHRFHESWTAPVIQTGSETNTSVLSSHLKHRRL